MRRTNELVPRCLPTRGLPRSSPGLALAALAALVAPGAACSSHERAQIAPEAAHETRPAPARARRAEAVHTAAAAEGAAKQSGSPRYMLPCPSGVPAALDPPANATLELAFPATGVQIYACSAPKEGGAPAWVLEGPHAVLNAGRDVAGIHFAGPTWQALDGSSLKGAKLAAADSPKGSAVPWLLLSATPSGAGAFAKITHVQRLDTEGGKAPAGGCDAQHVGEKVLVPYRSNYFFYRSAEAGETAHQCRSAAAKHKS
jgi:uncharacterized protein DUF3455